MEQRKYKGGSLDIIGDMFDVQMKYCEKTIAENPELVIMYDLESGFPYVATKEHRDAFLKMWEDTKPKSFTGELTGKIIYFGTGGEINESFNDIFYGKTK